jgi:hypothetical protein
VQQQTVSQVIAVADAPAPTFLTSDGPSMLGIGLMITGVLAVIRDTPLFGP